MEVKTKKVFGKIFNIISIAVLGVAICMLLFIMGCRISGRTPQLFGRSLHFVVTNSMEDEIMVGDLVVGKKTDIMDIAEGDDIIFVSPDPNLNGMVIVHRVRRIDDTGDTRRIYTYGINNIKDDTYPVTRIIGRVSSVSSFWGKIFNLTTLIFILLILGIVIIFYFGLKHFLKIRREMKEDSAGLTEENKDTGIEARDNNSNGS